MEKERTNVLFMHVLSGVFIEKQIIEEMDSPFNFNALLSLKEKMNSNKKSSEEAKLSFRLVLFLSEHSKRVIYFDSQQELESWYRVIIEAQGKQTRKLKDYYRIKNHILGEGSFGKVYEGSCKMSGRKVAIKTLNKRGMDAQDLEYQMTEFGILLSCFCENVVEIIDVFEENPVIHIVQELIDGVDLCTYLKTTPRTEALVKNIMQGIFKGVDYLHSIGIAHRDIKLENIMITKDERGRPLPKLIDFGLSTILLKG